MFFNNYDMSLKISLLTIAVVVATVCVDAQTARNPLNLEQAQVKLQKEMSSWKLLDEIFYHANGNPFDKRSYNYDANGRKTAEVTFRWSDEDKTWQERQSLDYLYTEDKTIVMEKSGQRNTSKTETVENADGKPVYAMIYSWNKNADVWSITPYLRCEWQYDVNGLLTSQIKQLINTKTNEWNPPFARILYVYQAGVLTEELFQIWNQEYEQWTDKGKYSYSFDNEQQTTAISSIYVSDGWVFDGKTIYRCDEEGKIVRCEFFTSDDTSFDTYSIMTYSESAGRLASAEAKDIFVFPNPVISVFELTVPVEYVGKVMFLYDGFGNQVKTITVTSQKTQVDLNGFSSGVYMLKIGDLSKKIIVGNF